MDIVGFIFSLYNIHFGGISVEKLFQNKLIDIDNFVVIWKERKPGKDCSLMIEAYDYCKIFDKFGNCENY